MFICLKYFQLLEIVSLWSISNRSSSFSSVLNNRSLSLIITLICVSPIVGRSLINTRSWKLALNLSVILQSVVCDLRVCVCQSVPWRPNNNYRSKEKHSPSGLLIPLWSLITPDPLHCTMENLEGPGGHAFLELKLAVLLRFLSFMSRLREVLAYPQL